VKPDKTSKRIIFWLHRAEDVIVSFLLSSILIFAITQIILRNFFDSGMVWADSLLRVMVLWLALAGAILASRRGKQINVDILSQFLPAHYKTYIKKLNSLFAAGICLLISYYSFQFVSLEYNDGSIAFAGVPAWLTEAIIPLSFGILGIRYLLQAFAPRNNSSKNLRKNNGRPES